MSATYLAPPSQNRFAALVIVLAAHAILAALLVLTREPIQHKWSSPITVPIVVDKPPAPLPFRIVPVVLPQMRMPALYIPPIDTSTTAHSTAVDTQVATPIAAVQAIAAAPAVVVTSAIADTPPSVDANADGNPKPTYPRVSRSIGEEGCVLLDVYVLADGLVGEIHVHRSSGFERLDEAALKAVSQWRFRPAHRAGQEVAMWYVQPITFNLHHTQSIAG